MATTGITPVINQPGYPSEVNELEAKNQDFQPIQATAQEKIEQFAADLNEQLQKNSQLEKKLNDSNNQIKNLEVRLKRAETGEQLWLNVCKKTTEATLPILKILIEDGEIDKSKINQENVKKINENSQAMLENIIRQSEIQEKYYPLPEEISETLSSRITAIDGKELNNRASEIKSLKTEELAKNLNALSMSLKELMEEALKPDTKVTPENLKSRLELETSKYKKLTANFKELETTIKEKHLKEMEAQVKTYNETIACIPEDHIKSIANFEKVTENDIKQRLENRKNVNDSRIIEHDRLAKDLSNIQISKEAIEWQLLRIEIFANIYTEVKTLYDGLSKLEGDIEAIKQLLRDQRPVKYNAGLVALEAFLKEINEKDFALVINCYNKHSEKGKNLRKNSEETIKALTDQINNAGNTLKKCLKNIHVYNDSVKNEINEFSESTIQFIQNERDSALSSVKNVWNFTFQKLNVKDNQYSLTYEINRLGYIINENKGLIPYDMTYSSWNPVGWYPKDYVISPFVPKKEEQQEGEEEKSEVETKV